MQRGTSHTPEARAAMSEKRKGRALSQEHKAKLSAASIAAHARRKERVARLEPLVNKILDEGDY